MMQNKNTILLMRAAAVFGNLLFTLWIIYNAVDEGFHGTMPEVVSGVFLICLLILNSYLVLTRLDREKMMSENSN